MIYTTRFFGTPYGIGGERGSDVTDPEGYAATALEPGQRMLVFATDDHDADPVARYVCSEEFGVTETNL